MKQQNESLTVIKFDPIGKLQILFHAPPKRISTKIFFPPVPPTGAIKRILWR